MIDGVYSMYGDFAPIKEIVTLLNNYKKLHLYADDAHGLGWIGKHGRGYILSQINFHPKLILATSLAKAFGAGGGVLVFPTQELWDKVRTCGGAFIFSGPQQIPVLGAGVASAKIFLSPEISYRQRILQEKISYCQKLLEEYGLPVVSNPQTPIFFIGLGLVRVGYNMVERLIKEGFFVNLSVFPAVPETCTGVRFTITAHHTFEDIKALVEAIAYHFPKVLEEEGRTFADISRAFKKVITFNLIPTDANRQIKGKYRVQHETTITNIDKKIWDKLMGNKGSFDWNGLLLLEETFNNNAEPENNWDFHYYIIWDKNNVPVLATFFTLTIVKDDMLASASVSKMIEKEREKNPYYLSSLTLLMGSLITEGNHLFIDRSRNDWKEVLMFFIDIIWKEQDRLKADVLNLRDFYSEDIEISDFLKQQGFLRIEIPDTHVIEHRQSPSFENYLDTLNADKRYFIKKRALKFEDFYDVRINHCPSEEEICNYYKLYKNVANRSYELKGFELPQKLFIKIAQNPSWEIIEFRLKSEFDPREEKLPIGVAINYKTDNCYCFLLTGLDYHFLEKYELYSQILLQIVKRSIELKSHYTFLGFTASQNKRKFGAEAKSKVAFIQMKDSYNMSVIDLITNKVEA
jgi:hypothetical protein